MYEQSESGGMAQHPDLVVRDAYLQDRDAVCDISIADGQIATIEASVEATPETEVEAGGDLVAPGFVDAHVHMDQARSLGDGRQPAHNDEPFDKEHSMAASAAYFEETPAETIEETVASVGRQAVAHGVTHVRTHAYVDSVVGTKSVQAVQAASERLADLLDVEIVAFPQQGICTDRGAGADLLGESLAAGADLVGGVDPATVDGDISAALETVFEVATAQDAGVDIHLHDAGSLGVHTLERLAAWTDECGHEGRVTGSHCYALADARDGEWLPVESLDALLARLAAVDIRVVTSYLTTPPGMPVRELQEAGIALGHGSDQVQDFWIAHGNINPVEEALVQSLKLGTDFEFTTNAGLDRIWRLLTAGGARVLDIEDDHALAPGTPADLVVHDGRSRQRVLIDQSRPRVVLKDGAVVARDGDVLI
jgi:cytosine/adenosine deaminase-related metal-dependent hydrolase